MTYKRCDPLQSNLLLLNGPFNELQNEIPNLSYFFSMEIFQSINSPFIFWLWCACVRWHKATKTVTNNFQINLVVGKLFFVFRFWNFKLHQEMKDKEKKEKTFSSSFHTFLMLFLNENALFACKVGVGSFMKQEISIFSCTWST